SNATPGTAITAPVATGTIVNDDPQPVISITGGANGEGNGQVFTLTRVGDAQADQSVSFTTSVLAGDTGQASDIVATSGIVTFSQGDTVKTITIPTVQDTLFEPAETFSVVLSAPTNGALLGTANAQGTILNDDPVPSLAISASSGV